MIQAERHQKILEILDRDGSLRTKEVSEQLGVSDETVRSDLEELEKSGRLERFHGGAALRNAPYVDMPLHKREEVRKEEKGAIARLAASRIRPDETIFLDASSTCLALARALPELPLTVLTNAHHVIYALQDREEIDLICTGGVFDQRSRSYVGTLAQRALERYNIHRMFFSGNGVDINRGVSEANSRQAAFKERVIKYSEEVCFLGDETKIGVNSSFFFCPVRELDLVITHGEVPEDFMNELASEDVATLVAGS